MIARQVTRTLQPDFIFASRDRIGRCGPREDGFQFARGTRRLMLLPAMVYVPTPTELTTHFRTVAEATGLPIMLYNNSPAYRVSVGLDTLDRLQPVGNIVAIKESAPDPRRFTDVINRFRRALCRDGGAGDIALEG